MRRSTTNAPKLEYRNFARRRKLRYRVVSFVLSVLHLIFFGTEELVVVCCLTSQEHASVSQERICSDNFTCCHTETEVADQRFYLSQSRYTDTGPTSSSTDPITPGAWQGSHWSASFKPLVWLEPEKIPEQAGFKPGIFRSRG